MARIAVRRVVVDRGPNLTGMILLGLGLGVGVGFLLGEIAGPVAERVVRRRPMAPVPGPVSRLVEAAQAVLDDDVVLRDCRLQVLAVGPGRIELHGWVPDRRSRARAAHLIGDAVAADTIINCLQVRGEDDRVAADRDDGDEQLA
jgi:hypothetical protein